ncbi:ferredoxin [Candidatus Dojkabacteria bacterium]|nr:ferredoxin [Candidatus Dojkabacteria bacterium]
MPKKIKIKINKEACNGCGTCISILPDIIEFDSNSQAEVKLEHKEKIIDDPQLIEQVMLAKESCPTEAFIVEIIE